MCQIFAGQDPANYQSITRSVRLDGHATSIRLESTFWDILDELADRLGCYGLCIEDTEPDPEVPDGVRAVSTCAEHPSGGFYCCRVSFISEMRARIVNAIDVELRLGMTQLPDKDQDDDDTNT